MIGVLLREATALDRYRREVDRLLAKRDRLTEREVRAVLAVLDDARKRTVAALAALAPATGSSYQVAQLDALRAALDREAAVLTMQLRRIAGGALTTMAEQGVALADLGLARAGIVLTTREISALQVFVARTFEQLSQDVGAAFRQRSRSIITRVVLGEVPVHQAQTAIGGLLTAEPALAGRSAGMVARLANEYLRNDLMTVFGTANQMHQAAVAEQVPDLRKYWLSSKDDRVRPDHVQADRDYAPGGSIGPIPWDDEFEVGGEKARYPMDPRLSGAQRTRCRCVSVSWRAEWFD